MEGGARLQANLGRASHVGKDFISPYFPIDTLHLSVSLS